MTPLRKSPAHASGHLFHAVAIALLVAPVQHDSLRPMSTPSSMSQQLKDLAISNRASAEEVARRTLEFMSALAGPSQ